MNDNISKKVVTCPMCDFQFHVLVTFDIDSTQGKVGNKAEIPPQTPPRDRTKEDLDARLCEMEKQGYGLPSHIFWRLQAVCKERKLYRFGKTIAGIWFSGKLSLDDEAALLNAYKEALE